MSFDMKRWHDCVEFADCLHDLHLDVIVGFQEVVRIGWRRSVRVGRVEYQAFVVTVVDF